MKSGFWALLLFVGLTLSFGLGRRQAQSESGGQTGTGQNAVPIPNGSVHLRPEKQQLLGLRFARVQRSEGAHELHLLGKVSLEDTRVYRVTAAVQGWVRGTYSDATGNAVKKDQQLATFYSPEFATFVNGFLTATDRGSATKESVRGVQYATDRLRAMGMSEAQIKEIAVTRQMPKRIDVTSPIDGFILSRNISPGMRFEERTEFYRIADLSHVWIVAELLANQVQYFRPGTVARVTLPGGRKVASARVSDVLPQVDPITRGIKLRLEADNPGLALRPEMFVDVAMPLQTPSALTIPEDAVLDSGLKRRVFVDQGNGFFESREVETGWHCNGRVQIVKGLREGESVVAPGAFLVDSESPLRTDAGTDRWVPSGSERGTEMVHGKNETNRAAAHI